MCKASLVSKWCVACIVNQDPCFLPEMLVVLSRQALRLLISLPLLSFLLMCPQHPFVSSIYILLSTTAKCVSLSWHFKLCYSPDCVWGMSSSKALVQWCMCGGWHYWELLVLGDGIVGSKVNWIHRGLDLFLHATTSVVQLLVNLIVCIHAISN